MKNVTGRWPQERVILKADSDCSRRWGNVWQSPLEARAESGQPFSHAPQQRLVVLITDRRFDAASATAREMPTRHSWHPRRTVVRSPHAPDRATFGRRF